ncbi:MAG: RAMP superfamily CRISPR-associated protein [Acidobacteriota bacterium]
MIIKTVTVKLVTPAMIGGSEAGRCDDPPTLRPPAIRGMLRFWTRALAGDQPSDLESELWGSTDVGQGISILNAVRLPVARNHVIFVRGGFHDTEMCSPDDEESTISLRIPDERVLCPLRAVVWTWLHLGAVGRRSRRGYGSLLWVPCEKDDDLLRGWEKLDPARDLVSSDALAQYLKRGFAQMRSESRGNLIRVPDPRSDRSCSRWFQLKTLDQIFVGGRVPDQVINTDGGLDRLIHGLAWDFRSTNNIVRSQMGGSGGKRLASPIMWRLFPTPDRSYIPVMTWSPREDITRIPRQEKGPNGHVQPTGIYHYLHEKLGFQKSLANKDLG